MAKKPQTKEKVEKYDTIDDLVAGLNRKNAGSIQYGTGTFVQVDAITTGLASVDVIMGCLGMPRKRIIEVFGNESCGKTTFCLHCVASCQAKGGIAAFIDAEHALDLDWARKIGVNVEKLLLSQPDSGDQAFGLIDVMIASGLVDMIIIDSVAAMVPKEELAGEEGGSTIGAQARMLGRNLRKLIGKCGKSKCVVIFINQLRDVVGGFATSFTKPEMTPGGRALKFYSSVRLQLRRAETLMDSNRPYAMVSKIKIVKNKVAPPFKAASLEFNFGADFLEDSICGIDKVQSLLEGASAVGAITVRGSNYYLGDLKLGAGKAATITNLRNNQATFDAVYEAIYAAARSKIKPPDIIPDTGPVDLLDDDVQEGQESKDTDDDGHQYLDTDDA